MVVYELTHLFFRDTDGLVYSPKNLGLYYSPQNVKQAVQYYSTRSGFYENQDAFSIRERNVLGNIIHDTIYEVLVYLHSENFEFETEIELGLYGNEVTAQNKLDIYCQENIALGNVPGLIFEKIVNKRIVNRKEWSEGFSVGDRGQGDGL